MNEQPVIVIGAGIAGLSAALTLAARGRPVVVVETCEQAGGKMRQLDVGGALVDSGPTVLTLRSVFDEMLAEAGFTLEDFQQTRRLELLARHAWDQDSRLDLYSDRERSAAAIGQFAGAAEARGYLAFCAEAARAYHTLDRAFLRAGRANALSLAWRIRSRGPGALLGIRPFNSLWGALGRHFRDPRLRQLFARYATYCGSSPWLAPATLMVIAHVEHEGVWRLAGGMQGLAQALYQACLARGVLFRFGERATTISAGAGRVDGVVLATGEHLPCRNIICSADPAALRAGLLGPVAASALAGSSRPQPPSLSAITWSLQGVVQDFPLASHNVFFSADYRREFEQLFGAGSVPDQPSIYVYAQDRLSASPPQPGSPERLFCLVNAPACGDGPSLQPQEIASCTQRTMQRLADCGLQIATRPDQVVVNTPADFARRFPGTRGALYGQATHGWRAAFRRPGARSRLPGLYLAGGGVHPGPGLPMVALSGRQAVQCLLQDQASMKRSPTVAIAGGTSMR